LRRQSNSEEDANLPAFKSGELEIDYVHRQVRVAGSEIHLTPKEYDLLKYMIQYRNRVLTHRQLLSKVWGAEFSEDTHTLRVHVANLRNKIEPDATRPLFIRTEPRIGYRFRATE
jgi:two-component system, OmpR family, KDP operon response regulator KdpE